MEQLILHLLGDYVFQSNWMANGKTSKYGPAIAHATVYSLLFLLLQPSWVAFTIILGTHFLIDRFRLAKYVCYVKNFIAPTSETFGTPVCRTWGCVSCPRLYHDEYKWENCKATGYPSETPVWLATWLMVIADNCMHLTINYLALRYL